MTRIIIVRHGQTEWNRVERFRGRVDVPLNEIGLRQAQAAACRIANTWSIAAVYYSDLSRTRVTAEAIATACAALMLPHPGLLDIDYGEWSGLSPEEVRERYGDLLTLWQTQPHLVHIPGGESLDDVRQRAATAMDTLAFQHQGETIVLVTHLVVCRVLLLAALGLDNSHFWRIRQETGTINILEWENGVYIIVSINDACHLIESRMRD